MWFVRIEFGGRWKMIEFGEKVKYSQILTRKVEPGQTAVVM